MERIAASLATTSPDFMERVRLNVTFYLAKEGVSCMIASLGLGFLIRPGMWGIIRRLRMGTSHDLFSCSLVGGMSFLCMAATCF